MRQDEDGIAKEEQPREGQVDIGLVQEKLRDDRFLEMARTDPDGAISVLRRESPLK